MRRVNPFSLMALLLCACLLLGQSSRKLIITAPSGIPRNGLVGMWIPALDFDARNLLTWSADLTNALWVAAGATKDAATLLTFTALNGNVYQAITTVAGTTYTLSFRARAITGNTALHFLHTNSATGNSTALVVNGTLTQYSISVLGRAGSGLVNFGIQDQNAAGFGQIEITDWQVNIGGLQPYNPTVAKQILYDRSGYNFHGQLGSTAGVDTNDPRWDPDGNYYTTDDYVILDASGPVYNTTTGYTVLVVVKGAAQSQAVVYGEGRSTTANPRMLIGSGFTDTSKLRVAITNDASGALLTVESAAVAFAGTWQLIGIREDTGNYTLFIDGALERGVYARGTTTLDKATIGALGRNTYVNFLTGTIPALIRWKRAISNEEYERTRRELRRMLAPSGVILP